MIFEINDSTYVSEVKYNYSYKLKKEFSVKTVPFTVKSSLGLSLTFPRTPLTNPKSNLDGIIVKPLPLLSILIIVPY
jgi:hypothetical protein